MAIKSFNDFWPFYLDQHKSPKNRILHVIGTGTVIALVIIAFAIQEYRLFFLLPIIGYLPAWIGHYVFEKNRPATFKHPVYSLIADFKMFFLIVSGKLPLKRKQ